jgi:copper(I)-binding protein
MGMWRSFKIMWGISALCCTLGAWAQTVSVADSWVRAAVRGQMATGAFMSLTAKENTRLVSVSSPVAGVAQIHEMKMDKDVMKMTALPNGLELPAGQTIELKPGGYHIMLMDLKAPITTDSTVPLTLTFQDAAGRPSTVELKLPVKTMAASNMHKH